MRDSLEFRHIGVCGLGIDDLFDDGIPFSHGTFIRGLLGDVPRYFIGGNGVILIEELSQKIVRARGGKRGDLLQARYAAGTLGEIPFAVREADCAVTAIHFHEAAEIHGFPYILFGATLHLDAQAGIIAILMTLKEFILNYRTEHGLSQRQFAAQCGLSNGYISMLERGENPKTKQPLVPTLPKLKKLADGMGCLLGDLLVMVDDMPVDLLYEAGDVLIDESDDLSARLVESGLADSLDLEITTIILQLSPEKKREALHYLRYLAAHEDD